MKNLHLKHLSLMISLLYAGISFSQSWNLNGNAAGVNNYVGTSNAVSLSLRTNALARITILHTSGNVGIGTTTPSAQLHTIGTVRLQGLAINAGLTNLVVTDANGNLATRDISTLNTWNTTGNTTAGFLGTNNNTALPFRTNSLERMRITETGNIGIGTSTPSAQFHTTGTVRFAGLIQANGLPRLLCSDGSGNISYKDIATMNDFWKSTGNALSGSEFIGSSNNTDLVFKTNNTERMRLFSNGNLSIGTVSSSARLHVNCNSNITTGVRFELLPMAPSGTVLVQDFAGNVFNSGIEVTTLVNLAGNKNEEASRIAALEKEIEELKSLLKKENPTSVQPAAPKAYLYQNFPNPTYNLTTIKLYVEGNTGSAKCNIYDMNNTLVKSYTVKENGEQSIIVNTQGLNSTVYFYTIELDGKIMDTKKLVLQQ